MALLKTKVDKKLKSWLTMRPLVRFKFSHRFSRFSVCQLRMSPLVSILPANQGMLIEAMLIRRLQANGRSPLSEGSYNIDLMGAASELQWWHAEDRYSFITERLLAKLRSPKLSCPQLDFEVDSLISPLASNRVEKSHGNAVCVLNEREESPEESPFGISISAGIVYGEWQLHLFEPKTEALIGNGTRICSHGSENERTDADISLEKILNESPEPTSDLTFRDYIDLVCSGLGTVSEKAEYWLVPCSAPHQAQGSYRTAVSVKPLEINCTDVLDTVVSGEPQWLSLLYDLTFSRSFYTSVALDVQTGLNLGAVYTPLALALWVAEELYRHLLPAEGSARILDPANGDGALLKAVAEVAGGAVELIGVDINQDALSQARKELPVGTQLYKADSLVPKASLPLVEAWRALIGEKPLTGIIANPPWGADVTHSPAELRALGYELANGQFDSYDLFVEVCLAIAPENAVLAFILPDSIFYPEHEPLRRLLLGSTQILSISRLGEGFFSGVYRGTVVVVMRKGRAGAEHTIDCMRLTKEWRQKILSCQATLGQAKQELVHHIRQARFLNDPQARFDIDVREQEEEVLVKMSAAKMPWVRWLASGRGIELSKQGKVLLCPQCKKAYPLPRNDDPQYLCRACNRLFTPHKAEQQQIVRAIQQAEAGWQPLIVGEDVDRYRCAPSRQVRLDVSGINYKTRETFLHRKLLIRKTGLGIKAAIDETGAYTNQVVFHYYVPPMIAAPYFLLDYLQGVLCSRVLLAYHLKRIGENEWRSHPYVTQQIIAELPIPDISEGTWEWRQAMGIADAVVRRRKVNSSSSEEDLNVDRLVAGFYGLTRADCHWVLDVLDQADALEPIRTLRVTERSALMPIRVA